MKKKVALVGCTGNIGKQTVRIVRENPERFSFSALLAGRDEEGLNALTKEFFPRFSRCAAKGELTDLELEEIFSDCDVALIAAGGFAGLRYTLAAVRAGKTVALANKESLVCGGELVTKAAKDKGVEIVPVDSEHSALFQALSFRRNTPFEKLVLTASGGPFFKLSQEELKKVTAKDALAHPTWNMGKKITIDSATLLNKGYEVIEAKWLYNADFSKIEAVVHPESIVHSIVRFQDGASIAQLAYPDMRLPIQLALTYPERLPCLEQLDFSKIGALHFYPFPQEKFPCYGLALQAGKAGGIAPTVLNGAGEVAVAAFLDGRIGFMQIAETIQGVLDKIPNRKADCFETLREADFKAKELAKNLIYG
ncbi:MAG: 1-deoxy-D-xylulose-5-phosphate reductoisomerase [Clostridia bacterium]|nr:1-deoxy-D-xylulose-5-phosphate reductoisomerase [Clostridia bacterium]